MIFIKIDSDVYKVHYPSIETSNFDGRNCILGLFLFGDQPFERGLFGMNLNSSSVLKTFLAHKKEAASDKN